DRLRLFVRTDNNNRLRVWDRMTGTEVLDQALGSTVLAQMLWSGQANAYGPPQLRARLHGRVIVLSLGSPVLALDLAGKRVLWERKLEGFERSRLQNIQTDPKDGSIRLSYANEQRQRLTTLPNSCNAGVAIAREDGLGFFDLNTGAPLWKREDISGELAVAVDDEHVYAVEMAVDGSAVRTHVLRAKDGSRVAAPDFAAWFNDRVQFDGRRLLYKEKGKPALRLVDVATGKELWKETLPEGAHV